MGRFSRPRFLPHLAVFRPAGAIASPLVDAATFGRVPAPTPAAVAVLATWPASERLASGRLPSGFTLDRSSRGTREASSSLHGAWRTSR